MRGKTLEKGFQFSYVFSMHLYLFRPDFLSVIESNRIDQCRVSMYLNGAFSGPMRPASVDLILI